MAAERTGGDPMSHDGIERVLRAAGDTWWGSEHRPTVIDSLIHRDCVEESCGHMGDCPTHQVIVCQGPGCMGGEPVIGEVSYAAEWPCSSEETR